MRAADTTPIRPEERFDEAAVTRHLREALPDLVAEHPISYDQFPGGAANLTYRAVAGPVELVLRRAPLGDVARGGHDMAREHKVLSRLWRRFPQAPRAWHYCGDPSIMGKPFFVMERRQGHVVRDAWPAAFGEGAAARRRTAESLVETLARLHRIDPADVGLSDLGRPEGFVSRQVEGWAARWEDAKTRDVPDVGPVLDALRGGVPEPQASVVLHNDYKLDNTMLDDDGEVVAVFDWDMATLGDPLVDLATLVGYWADASDPTYLVFAERAVTLTPYMTKDEVVARYAAAAGFRLDDFEYYLGLAYFRIAVIIEQIFARYARGQTTDARFARYEALAPLLVAAARRVLAA
ncbi:MAG TPA: phosphotransferase family protein [Acidimicrobiia bacterium]|jgi:aminoglycoside phosphotransferase (APT) family kinase protein